MQAIIPYLNFSGQAEQALSFYQQAFSGEVINQMHFADNAGDFPIPEEWQGKIMHAHFKSGELEFMASDGMPNEQLAKAGKVELNLNFADGSEQQRVFNALSSGGEVLVALQDTFWGARFGRVVDRFGIAWMLNCQLSD